MRVTGILDPLTSPVFNLHGYFLFIHVYDTKRAQGRRIIHDLTDIYTELSVVNAGILTTAVSLGVT